MDFTTPNQDSHVIDMDSVEEAKFEVYPKGWYDFDVIEHTYELSQNSGEPMWKVTLQFSDAPNPVTGEMHPLAGKKMPWYISFSGKAVPYTKKMINATWPGLLEDPNWRTNDKFDVKKVGDAGLFVGEKLKGLIKHSTYQGETRANIAQVQRITNNAFMNA